LFDIILKEICQEQLVRERHVYTAQPTTNHSYYYEKLQVKLPLRQLQIIGMLTCMETYG
jgi:hypothetical protein